MARTRHTRLVIILLGIALVAVVLFGAGYAVADYRSAQTFSEYRQKQSEQQKIQKEMQEDLSRYSRASAAHMEVERAVAALSPRISRIEASQRKEYIELRAEELEAERRAALRDVRKYMEVSE